MDKDFDFDKKLYKDYLNGETKAFEILYLKYKDKIKYFVFNIVKDIEKAEDITQETFMYILKNKIKDEYSFKYSIFMIARSRAINELKSSKRREKIDREYLIFEEYKTDQDALEILEKQEEREEILNAIDSLDEKYRNVIYLNKIEEMSYKEIADIYKLSIQNVKNLIHRGKIELRKILIKKGLNEMNKVKKVVILIICISVILSGIVYATKVVLEKTKVWKEPEKFNWSESNVTKEDEEKAISDEEIERIVNERMKLLGYENAKIESKDIIKFPEYKKMQISGKMDNGIGFTLDAITGKFINLSDDNFDEFKIKSTASKKEAKKVAQELYKNLGYEEGEYELVEINKNQISEDDPLWRADFCKKYDGIANIYQCIRISFVPEVKRIKMLTVFDEPFENNEVKITKEEAIKIAKNKLKDIGRDESKVKSIIAELSIEKMNTIWFDTERLNENNKVIENKTETNQTIDTSGESYRVPETVIRKVWKVTIDSSEEFAVKDDFFVDATTGEIIGGDTTK